MNKYEMTTMKKKDDIIKASLSLFERRGFSQVSIKEIAALANVSQVSIYNYFGSKDALFSHCVETVVQEAIKKAKDILLQDMGFVEKIRHALTVCTTEINIALSNNFTHMALSDPTMYNLLIKNINHSKSEIYREYIEYGKSNGAIDTALSTNIILEFMEALNMIGSTKTVDEDREKELSQLYHLLLFGLVGKPENSDT